MTAATVDATERPLVSVVIPTFGRPVHLRRALESVRQQSCPTWEAIVVDDDPPGSEARVLVQDVVAEWGDPRLRTLGHDRNRGAAAARNTGIAAARGRYVAFLDDDDTWHPEKLARQVVYLEGADPNTVGVGCAYEARGPNGRREPKIAPAGAARLSALLRRNQLGGTSTFLVRRTALEEVGGFDVELPAKQDVDLYLRLAQRFDLGYLPEVLVVRFRDAEAPIGDDLEAQVRAHARFEQRYGPLLRAHPKARRYRTLAHARVLARSGRHAEARRLLRGHLRASPWDASALLALLRANGATMRVTRALRALRRRLRGPSGASPPA